jgi:6-phosphogluconolactonase (cycloisomerase 2 family)
LFNSDGTRLIGVRVGSSQIDTFAVGHDGLLTDGQTFSAQTGFFGTLGSEFSPTHPDQLFVTNAHLENGTGAHPGTVSVFTLDSNGALTAIANSPFADDGTAACWIEISSDGRFAYVVNTGSSSVSTFSIDANGTLHFTGSAAIGGKGAEDVRLAPDGGTLWIVEAGSDAIVGFSVGDDGSLTSLGSATAGPAGATPTGIVVT